MAYMPEERRRGRLRKRWIGDVQKGKAARGLEKKIGTIGKGGEWESLHEHCSSKAQNKKLLVLKKMWN